MENKDVHELISLILLSMKLCKHSIEMGNEKLAVEYLGKYIKSLEIIKGELK